MTTVGLLVCGHVHPAATGFGGDYPELFGALLGPLGLELRSYAVDEGDLPASLDECDGWIGSPSASSVYDDDAWIADASEIVARIVTEARPFVGICFGHQLLAHALGGRVERAEVGWGVGAKSYELVEQRPWLAPATTGDRVHLIASHQDQVVVPPPGARLLATADYCPHAMFELGERAFGLQPHPEFTAPLSAALIDLRAEKVGADVVGPARASLAEPLDRELAARWITAFLTRT